jgi:hypothetical protein
MNSIINKIDITPANRQRKSKNNFFQIIRSSPLFKVEYGGFDAYDQNDNIPVINFFKVNSELLDSFCKIKINADCNFHAVTYNIELDKTIVFRIYDAVQNTCQSILIHDVSAIPMVEFLFKIKLDSTVLPLHKISQLSFDNRLTYLREHNPALNKLSSFVYLDLIDNQYSEIYGRDFDAYKAGAVHIKYLNDSLPESVWLKPKTSLKDGEIYKRLFYEKNLNEHTLRFDVHSMKEGELKMEFCFYNISYCEFVNEEHLYGYENEVLLQKLKPIYRSYSMVNLLKNI